MPGDLTMANPFASTHSLDANPFDDPPSDVSHANRLEDLNRRERELQNREQELTRKADNIRKHGRNNFPPCMSLSVFLIPSLFDIPHNRFPTYIPFNSRWNSGDISTAHDTHISDMAPLTGYLGFKPGCLHFHSACGFFRRWPRCRGQRNV